MTILYHQNLTSERWQQFTLVEQMANIGSEVGRTIKNKGGNEERFQGALYRALELFDLTREDSKNKARLKEISRAREAFLDYAVGDNVYQSTAEQWEKYFTNFALAARRRNYPKIPDSSK